MRRLGLLYPAGDNSPTSAGLRARPGTWRTGFGNNRTGAPAVRIRPPLPVHTPGSVATHDRADFAQEFLRRNADYRAAWAAARGVLSASKHTQTEHPQARHWGLEQLFDPDRPVHSEPAIWCANCASQVVSLTPAPADFPETALLPDDPPVADFVIDGARHLVVDVAGVRHRLQVPASARSARVAILLPPLCDPLRAAACDAARRMFAHLSPAEPAAMMRPSALQRQRLALLLRVLDASLSGASSRDIGVRIVYPWLDGLAALAWKASSERRRVFRVVAEARYLAAAGYRDLLTHRG